MGVYIDEQVWAFDLERALDEIAAERRDYALGYRYELDQRLSVAVYLLLKRALRDEYGIDENPVLVRGTNGKPRLVDHPEIHFNFSHCRQAAACVVASLPVGIDIETIAPVDWEVAQRVLSDQELRAVRDDARPDVAFARFWTCKEALIKCRGDALDERKLPDLLKVVNPDQIETRIGADWVLSVVAFDVNRRIAHE